MFNFMEIYLRTLIKMSFTLHCSLVRAEFSVASFIPIACQRYNTAVSVCYKFWFPCGIKFHIFSPRQNSLTFPDICLFSRDL